MIESKVTSSPSPSPPSSPADTHITGVPPSSPPAQGTASGHRERPDLLELAWRRKWRHIAAGALLAVAAVAIGSTLTPRFRAAAQLLVDPRDIKVLDNQLTPQADAQNIGITLVESQALVLASNRVLGEIVDKLKLAEDDEFNGRRVSPVRAVIARTMDRIGIAQATPSNDERTAALSTLQRQVRVRRLDRTYVLEATSTAESREKARTILETMLEAYLDDQARSRAEVARRMGQDLDAGVGSLRASLEAAERRLSTYMQQNELVGVRGQFVNEQQLADLNAQLVTARVEVSRLEARRNGAVAGGFDNLPEALASPTLRDLRASLARTSQQKAQLEAQMLPGHPAVRAMSENERKLVTMINAEVGRIREASDIEVARARNNERQLDRKLDELRAQLNRTNHAQIQLRELERDVEVNRNLYRQALTRTREAQEQGRLNTANVRVISQPLVERDRVFPPTLGFLAGFGFLLGALSSIGLLLARQLVRGR
jgi:succinoglycan biosynthesis transport protein ExoP